MNLALREEINRSSMFEEIVGSSAMGGEMSLPTVTQDTDLSNSTSGAALVKRKDPLPATLLLLTVVTGIVDAVSFLGLGHVLRLI